MSGNSPSSRWRSSSLPTKAILPSRQRTSACAWRRILACSEPRRGALPSGVAISERWVISSSMASLLSAVVQTDISSGEIAHLGPQPGLDLLPLNLDDESRHRFALDLREIGQPFEGL